MKLLQILLEASSLQIPDIKKAMVKDKKVATIFKKDATLDDIDDKEGFLSTLKFYIFNNENVRMFVNSRNNIKYVTAAEFNEFRKLRVPDLTQKYFDEIKEFLTNMFKEHTSVSKGTMSTDLKKELRDWANQSGYYHSLPGWAMKELESLPGIKPTKRVLLYRGILFSESSLKSYERYDGTLEVGSGQKFLKTIRKGGREVDLTWDKPSSWTTSKEVADRFAQYGPASSSTSAMFGWLGRMSSGKAIDGALGYVIATYANPEDILIDLSSNTIGGLKHGDEAEMILKPGTYLARVAKKYTVSGEVSPDTTDANTDHPVFGAITEVKSFLEKNPMSSELLEIVKMSGEHRRFWGSDSAQLSGYPDLFKKLITNGLTTMSIHLMDKLIKLYNDEVSKVGEIKNEEFMSLDDSVIRDVEIIQKFIARFTDNISHSKFKSEKNPKAKGKVHELSGEEYRATISTSDLAPLEKDLLQYGRIIDSTDAFKSIANAAGVELPSTKFSQFGSAKQKPVIDEVISAFFKKYGITEPEELADKIKIITNLIRKAYRNYAMIDKIDDVYKELSKLNHD